ITDHSERSWASRKLLSLEVPLQREEIDTVRSHAPGIEILPGVEVDIMPDGSLDFDECSLAGFDIVLASLHDANGQDGRRLTDRYLQAMRHPLVNVITHPANRSPALSDGYELDFDRLFEVAVETGTAMEIDGAPGHLDMDGRVARRAADAGVTIVINSDCHRAEALGRQMSFGIGTARRGWVGPEQVLNTRGIDGVRQFVARKRGRSAREGAPAHYVNPGTRLAGIVGTSADEPQSSSVLCDSLHRLSCYFLYPFWALPKRGGVRRNWLGRFRSDIRACAISPRTSCRRTAAACCAPRRAS